MIHKIINWDKQEVAKGKKTVRTACLKGKLEFKFFSSPESNQIYIVHWNFSNCLLNFFTIHYLFKYRNQSLFHPDLMYIKLYMYMKPKKYYARHSFPLPASKVQSHCIFLTSLFTLFFLE